MLKDFKFMRRNLGKNPIIEEIENVPVNPSDSVGSLAGPDSSRPPLNAIQGPIPNTRASVEQDAVVSSHKIERTPTKSKGRNSNSTLPHRTPDKQGVSARYRFGWGPKNESCSTATESHDEGRVDASHMSQPSQSATMSTPRSTRTAGKAHSNYSESHSTQSTPTKSVTKPPYPGFCLSGGSRPLVNGGARMANFAALSKGVPISSASSTVVNPVEVPHFDLKEDPSFWMDHSVQVLIRVRPLNNMERSTQGYNRCLKQENAQCITWVGQPETRFTFDHVACETIDQETLFRMVGLPMVKNCLAGYNSSMFAYGQTGSGKTYTMLGETEELQVKPSLHRGMMPRVFEFLFAQIRAEEESRRDERLKYNCKCSFLEIYNEQITDLLDPSSTNLLLREDIKKGVYVENLSEIEVHNVVDILRLINQGSSNRKVAATNMNRESSRSHSVFTCVIECTWEKDSTSNLRFARLNLVDLAGSERQKTSGAEGERLKEAANINKSLSTLGHVIMILVDVAHGKPRHVPYRDSRLTFLLQDSLGGNSKTMIIANVSPSISCAAETLNTLKFAQRAKLIQNNAVVNEDSSGDVIALQHQIQLLKEELSALRRQNVSRSLSFGPTPNKGKKNEEDNICNESAHELDQQETDNLLGYESKGTVRVSCKQLKSLEATLSGALRREQMAETSIKQFEAEIEQLNRLVRQREEDTRCTKMMLKFREDKIQRMESLLGDLMPAEGYLMEETSALAEEVQLLRAKVDKNPEVTRFALENIRLLEQLRRFQDFYEEGEREMLLAEVSELRNQLVPFLDGNLKEHNNSSTNMLPKVPVHISKENDLLQLELQKAFNELEDCRSRMNSCLEKNEKLRREIVDLRASLNGLKPPTPEQDSTIEVIKESILEAPSFAEQAFEAVQEEMGETWHKTQMKHAEEIMNLQLELDILQIILKEEKSSRVEAELKAQRLNRDLELTKGKVLLVTKQCEEVKQELEGAKSVIEALESQNILSINELDDLRNSNNCYAELLHKQELEISFLKEQLDLHNSREIPSLGHSEKGNAPLQTKLWKIQKSLEKAKRLNSSSRSDRACHSSTEEEMDEVCRQVEAETAEVIVCLQEEIDTLQQQVQDIHLKEMRARESLALSQNEWKELQEKLHLMTEDNKTLGEKLEMKEVELRKISEEWKLMGNEIEVILSGGNEALNDASDQLDIISTSFPQKRAWISEQLCRMTKRICEKELLIDELNHCLMDANNRRLEMESMLSSLRGASFVMAEAHMQESTEKDKELLCLASQLKAKTSAIEALENQIKNGEKQLQDATTCATVAFIIVNRLSEINSNHLEALSHTNTHLSESMKMGKQKDSALLKQATVVDESKRQIQSLRMELQFSEEICGQLRDDLSEEQKHSSAMESKLREEESKILETREKLTEFITGVSTLKSCMNDHVKQMENPLKLNATGTLACISTDVQCQLQKGTGTNHSIDIVDGYAVEALKSEIPSRSLDLGKNAEEDARSEKNFASGRALLDISKSGDATISLLKIEIESALECLEGVKSEMAKLFNEKKLVQFAEKCNWENVNTLMTQVLAVDTAMTEFEEQFGCQMASLDDKLQRAGNIVKGARDSWYQQKELFEVELGNEKVMAGQKTAEASCILAKFEEAQDTLKDADIMINELMIANETLKLEIDRMKNKEIKLVNERDCLTNEVQCLQTANNQKDQHCENLVRQFDADFMGLNKVIMELEDILSLLQTTSEGDLISIAYDFIALKSQFHDLTKMMKSWLEDIWSEIIAKDCAVSVLHLCHMGILLETVTGLNAENSILHHGLCESNSVISELRDHNSKSRKELELCTVLKGKLLVDIKSSFDRISRKEDETGELTAKLTIFEKKILDLQLQEELMLQRSNYMGSELAMLVKQLDLNNRNALTSLLDQEMLVKNREESLKSQEDIIIMDLFAKDLGLFILTSELEQMAVQKENVEREKTNFGVVIESIKNYITLLAYDAGLKEQIMLDQENETALLQKEAEEAQKDRSMLFSKLNRTNLRIFHMDKEKVALDQDIHLLKEAVVSSNNLQCQLNNSVEEEKRLSSQLKILECEYEKLLEEVKMKESTLESSSDRISILDQQNQMLKDEICMLETASKELLNELESSSDRISILDQHNQMLKDEICMLETASKELLNELEMRDAKLTNMSSLVGKNESLQDEVRKSNAECSLVHQELLAKKQELEGVENENQRLQDKIFSLENCISGFQGNLDMVNAEMNELQLCQSTTKEELCLKNRDLQLHVDMVNCLKEENISLRNEIRSVEKTKCEAILSLSSNITKSTESLEAVNMTGSRLLNVLCGKNDALEKMFGKIHKDIETSSKFLLEFEFLADYVEVLISENLSLRTELSRKEDVLEGLLFDLRLLQESASGIIDQKDEIEELATSLEALRNELAVTSYELGEAVSKNQLLESQLQEKIDVIFTLKLDISNKDEQAKSLSSRNVELTANVEDAFAAKCSAEEELADSRKVSEGLEAELIEMGSALRQMNDSFERMQTNLDAVSCEKKSLLAEILVLKKDLELAQNLAEEHEAIAAEAEQAAEGRKLYAQDKEEEVKLLEKSVEELECTVNVLESKVDIIKGEAERQQLEREELELELHTVKQQMHDFKSNDVDLKRHLDEKEKNLQEAFQRLKILERDKAARDAEIALCKAHISELNTLSEAQALDYKQKYKALETMAERVKPDGHAMHPTITSANKLEKNGSKSRGSGSPFKCIGLGLVQQIKSEKDEELTAGRYRIEELEALAASRQKEIFVLNARLAAAESMTHDVIRDLLGLKSDMTSYASLLDNQHVQKIAEKTQVQNVETQVKEQEILKLKQQLSELVEERQGWLEEIDRKQAEVVAAQVALEKLHERDRLLSTENEIFKVENANNKKKVLELEDEVKKLSGHQNLQQRIHHHAKIKEENHLLRNNYENLCGKLRQTDVILLRVKEELAQYRASNGRTPYINLDLEEQLKEKLKETEEEKLELAQKFLSLCTCIVKAAGITTPSSDISLALAKDALEQLKKQVTSLERELQELKLKNRIASERIRLSELMPQTSPLSSRAYENQQTANSGRSPFFTALDR